MVSLVHDADEASHASALVPLAESVHVAPIPRVRNLVRSVVGLASARPTTHAMLDSPVLPDAVRGALGHARPDVILAFCSGSARWAFTPQLADLPLVLDLVDVDSEKWRDLALVTPPPLRWIYQRESRVLGRFEAKAALTAHATLVVTDKERADLRRLAPAARIEVIGNGVDVDALSPATAPPANASVVFCGMMDYAPNIDAAVFLAQQIWPRVREHRPDATLTLVGAKPTPRVQALGSGENQIIVTGAVPDVRPYLWGAAVSVAPLMTARGIQNKVLEAAAAGLPVVVTPNVAAALPPALSPAIRVGSDAESLAREIVEVLARGPEARRAMAKAVDTASLTWDRQLASLLPLLEEAAAAGPRRKGVEA